MAERGQVLRFKSRIGFGARGHVETAVVVSVDALNDVLPTIVIVPLDRALAVYGNDPLAIRVPAKEAGAAEECVALVAQVRAVRAEALAAGAAGALGRATMAKLDRALRAVLGL